MCIICVDFQKQLITPTEARRNMGEMVIDKNHELEILLMLEEDEIGKLVSGGHLPTKKISDAPARYSFFVDVGSVTPEQTEAFLRKAKKSLQDKKLRNHPEDGDDHLA